MSVKLITVPSYVKAVQNSSLKERSALDYRNAMKSTLYMVKGNIALFRTYLNEIEYFEFAFQRVGVGNIQYLHIAYGCDYDDCEE